MIKIDSVTSVEIEADLKEIVVEIEIRNATSVNIKQKDEKK